MDALEAKASWQHFGPLFDDEAEHHLAGIACISVAGADRALDRVPMGHWHDPRALQVVTAAMVIPDLVPGGDPDPISRRIDEIADRCGIYPALLGDWVRHAPCMWDRSGSIAERVLAAADRRRVAEQAIATLEGLGVKVRWEDVAA